MYGGREKEKFYQLPREDKSIQSRTLVIRIKQLEARRGDYLSATEEK